MSDKCIKCGSDDINISYIKEGENLKINGFKVENEFVTSEEWVYGFDHYAKKEHLQKGCKACQYKWKENTLYMVKK